MPITNSGIVAAGQLPATKGTLFTTTAASGHYFVTLGNSHTAALPANIYIKKSGGTSRIVYSDSLALKGSAGASKELPVRGKGYLLLVGDIIEGDDGGTGSKIDFTIEAGTES